VNDQIKPPEGSGSKALSALKSGGTLLPIYPQSIEEVYRFSQMAALSGVLKPVVRRVKQGTTWVDAFEDDEAMVARGSMIIAQGMEIGMPPLQALQLIALINGRLTVHSEGVPALLWSHHFTIEEWFVHGGAIHKTAASLPNPDTWDDATAAHCRITRPNGVVVERAFSVAMAKTAKLWDRRATIQKRNSSDTYANDSAWFRFPDRLLRARAIGFAAKDGASDAMRGMMVMEEAIDIQRTQEERNQDTIAPVETSVPALPFDISLDLDPVPVQEQKPAKEPEKASEFPSGNIDPAFPDGLADEQQVIPDDDQVLSRVSEAKLVLDLGELLSKAVCPGEITSVERKLAGYLSRISDDCRTSLTEAIDAARKRINS
jgi:hypothetical protein